MSYKNIIQELLKRDFVRFCLVGSVGFIVTAICKGLFQNIGGIDAKVAIMLGCECGVISNFIFHENWTYNNASHKDKSLIKKFLHFQIASLGGLIIFTMVGSAYIDVMHHDSILTLVLAAASALLWNYTWAKFFVFSGESTNTIFLRLLLRFVPNRESQVP